MPNFYEAVTWTVILRTLIGLRKEWFDEQQVIYGLKKPKIYAVWYFRNFNTWSTAGGLYGMVVETGGGGAMLEEVGH